MVRCRFLLLALVAVLVTGDEFIQQPPLACTHNGKRYQLYAKWASTVPGECAEYTCQDNNKTHPVTCMLPMMAQDPNKICYEINVANSTYPYCCTRYHCVNKKKKKN